MGAPETNHPIKAFPIERAREAIVHSSALELIGHIHEHLWTIIDQNFLLYDIQTNICDHLFRILDETSHTIRKHDEVSLRKLLQTVYRGMRGGMFHGIDTRQTSINILREKVVPLITQILEKEEQQEEETEMMLTPSQQIKETETSTPPPTHPKPIIEPQGESPRGENLRKSKYSSDNPPKIPAGFHVDWEAKKWRAFCLFYGYSPKTGKFDNQPHTREQIAEVLQVTIFDIAVYFSSNKKYLASWKPKPKKQPKPAQVKEK